MQIRPLAKVLALATGVAVTALLVGSGATSASATTPEHLTLLWESNNFSTFTLPTTDGFDDSIRLDITSNHSGTVDMKTRRLSGHGGIPLAGTTAYVLGASGSAYITSPSFTDSGLTAGSWQLTFTIGGVTKKTVVRIGSGVATSVKVTASPSKLFVGNDAAPHMLSAHVVAKDELGTSLPIVSGWLGFAEAHQTITGGESVSSSGPTVPGATAGSVDVEDDVPGTATLKVSEIQGPVSSTHPPSATIHPVLSVVKLTSLSVKPTYTTLYPNASTAPATDFINVTVKDNAGVALPLVNSTESITRAGIFIEELPINSTNAAPRTWDGLENGSIDPGVYTLKVVVGLGSGGVLTKTLDLTVSDAQPVERQLQVTYPGSDITKKDLHGNAKCSGSGSALDCVSKAGQNENALIRESVPKAVLALAKPLGYLAIMQVYISGYSSTGGEAEYEWGSESGGYSNGTIDITSDGDFQDGPHSADNNADKVSLEYSLGSAISLDLTKFTVTYDYWSLPKQ